MTRKKMSMEILNIFNQFKHLLDKPLTKEDVTNIVYYCDKSWYLQLLKEYSIIHLLIVLEYQQENEEYLECKSIVEVIRESNKNFGTTYKENIEYYEDTVRLR